MQYVFTTCSGEWCVNQIAVFFNARNPYGKKMSKQIELIARADSAKGANYRCLSNLFRLTRPDRFLRQIARGMKKSGVNSTRLINERFQSADE